MSAGKLGRKLTRLGFLLLWLALSGFSSGRANAPERGAPAPSHPGFSAQCRTALDRLVQEPGWQEKLIDPAFTAPDEMAARVSQYAHVHACLDDKEESLSEAERTIHLLSEYFLVFAAGYGDPENRSTLWQVDPAESDDPALVKLRTLAGLPPPPGVFYVRLYTKLDDMPVLVREAFDQEHTAGVTLLTRYIAVLVIDTLRWQNRGQIDLETKDTLSHELVHAYINAGQGFERSKKMPVWYREGLAIYFSGSGKTYTYMSPGWSFTREPPEDYQQYDENFQYLEEHLGQAQLIERIRRSVESADPSVLYRDLGSGRDEEFLQQARSWSAAQKRRQNALACLALPASIGLVLAFFVLRQPEFICQNCQTGGRRASFQSGTCPHCGAPVDLDGEK